MNKWFSISDITKEYTSIKDFPENTYGFVYIVTHTPTGKAYVGKKALYHNVSKKLTKKELAEQSGPGRKSTSKKVQKESDWKTYHGSSKSIMEMIKNGKEDEFTREILVIVPNKKLLTYYETKILFTLGVLENSEYYFNDNILGKFFAKDFL
jgi:serine/threonine protein kinase